MEGKKKKKKTKFQEEYLTPENKYPIQLCTITILIAHVNVKKCILIKRGVVGIEINLRWY